MMIAVVGDCGGNAPALQAALGAIADEGILTVFQTGNLAGTGGVDTVIALLKEHGVAVCQGDLDRMLVRFEQKAGTMRGKLDEELFAWLSATHGALSSAGLEYLRALHKRIDRSIDRSMDPSLPSRSQPNLRASCQGQLLVEPRRFFASHFVQPASSAIYPQTFRYRSVGMEKITQTACFKAFPLRTPHKRSASRLHKVDLGLDCRLPAGTRVFVVS